MTSLLLLPVAGLLGLGGPEVVLVFIVVMLLFGGAKLPALAKGLGQSIREFKKATADDEPREPVSEELPKK
jgi:sec-independent protein translocase protein TatA